MVGRLIPNSGSASCWLLLSHHTHGDSLCRTRAHTSSHRAPRGIAGPLPEAAPARKGARGDIHQSSLSRARPGSPKEKQINITVIVDICSLRELDTFSLRKLKTQAKCIHEAVRVKKKNPWLVALRLFFLYANSFFPEQCSH